MLICSFTTSYNITHCLCFGLSLNIARRARVTAFAISHFGQLLNGIVQVFGLFLNFCNLQQYVVNIVYTFAFDIFSHFIILQIYVWRTRKAYFIFVYEACPAIFYKTFRPLRIGRLIFITLLINNNHVFFDGCRPLALK